MASPQVEKEIDDFANSYPLRRRSIMDRLRIVPNDKHYDRLWRQALKDMAEDQFLESVL